MGRAGVNNFGNAYDWDFFRCVISDGLKTREKPNENLSDYAE